MKRVVATMTLSLVALATAATVAVKDEPPLKVAVLAFRPKPQTLAQWQPLAGYLESALSRPVELNAYDHAELAAAVARRTVDMVITTPNHFILLKQTAGLTAPLATLVSSDGINELDAYGGVIIARAGRDDLESLSDLAGRRVAAASLDAFGGYQMQALELLEAHVPLPTGDRMLLTGQPHDLVVEAILTGRAEVGFIRAGLLEALVGEGKLEAGQVKVINRRNTPGFPYAVSTRLYPEWPVAVTPQTDKGLAGRLSAALLLLPRNSLPPPSGVSGFAIAANYDGVENLLRALRLPPFERPPEVTLADLWRRYAPLLITVTGLLWLLAGAIAGLVIMYRRSQRSLRELERLAQKEALVLASLAEGVYGVDSQGRCIFINPRALALLGFTASEVIGESAERLFHGRSEDDTSWPTEASFVGLALRDGPKRELRGTLFCKDGRPLPVSLTVSAMRRGDAVVGAVVAFQDVTEPQRAQDALREIETRYRQIVDTAREGICALDSDGGVVFVNARMAELLGCQSAELLGRPFTSLMFEEDVVGHRDRMEAHRRGLSESYERRLRRFDGQTLWTLASASPIFDAAHRFNGSFAMFTDITERRRNDATNAARLHLVQFSLTHSLDELLEETLNEAERLTGSVIGFYHFVEDDQISLTLQNWSTRTKVEFCKAEGKGLHYSIDEAGVWVDCVRQRKAVIHNDYASLPHKKGMPDGHATVIRELVVPVFRGEKVSSILGVGNKAVDYDEKDVETVSLLADLAWEIAERTRVEEALQAERRLFVGGPNVAFRWKASEGWPVEYVSPNVLEQFGYAPEDFTSGHVSYAGIIHPDDSPRVGAEVVTFTEAKTPFFAQEYRLARADGEYCWIYDFTVVRRNTRGEVTHYHGYISDISERKQAESALRHVASTHPYDNAPVGQETLRGSTDAVAAELADEVAARIVIAGLEVVEARISSLAYAPEIAHAMLQRQQAAAVIAAREKIVEGAVSMVRSALQQLEDEHVVDMDEERKAAMVSNLLVVLCGSAQVAPVVNTGSLYT